MIWEGVRSKYPNSWILFEAIEAHLENGKRVVDKLSVLDSFEKSEEAIVAYKDIHIKEPKRELYVTHTKKEQLQIIERKGLGIRV